MMCYAGLAPGLCRLPTIDYSLRCVLRDRQRVDWRHNISKRANVTASLQSPQRTVSGQVSTVIRLVYQLPIPRRCSGRIRRNCLDSGRTHLYVCLRENAHGLRELQKEIRLKYNEAQSQINDASRVLFSRRDHHRYQHPQSCCPRHRRLQNQRHLRGT